MSDYVVRANLTAKEKAARNNRLFEIKLSSAKKKKLNLSRLGFTPLAPGEQLVFNPESMTAEQQTSVVKPDGRKAGERRNSNGQFITNLETNTVLKARLAEVQDKSALKQKRHQYEKDEKRTICQFISAWKNRERARIHLKLKKGIHISKSMMSDWMAKWEYGHFDRDN
jgi:ribosome recycling factor